MKLLLYPLLCSAALAAADPARRLENATTTATDGNSTTTGAASCTSNGDCAETEFCGTDKTCLELTCLNWSLYSNEGDNKYDDTPCENKGEEFCGRDGTCYKYDCEHWFKFGPAAWTGYNPDKPTELTCDAYTNGVQDKANGIVFSCKKFEPGKEVLQTKAVAMVFNEKCVATPAANTDFECYQFQDGTSFDSYQEDVARLNLNIPPCDGAGQPPLPEYWYEITLRQTRPGVSEQIDVGPESSSSFNLPNAYKPMYAALTSDDPAQTGDGTMADNSNNKTSQASEGIMKVRVRALLLGAIGSLLL